MPPTSPIPVPPQAPAAPAQERPSENAAPSAAPVSSGAVAAVVASHPHEEEDASAFECNICLELAKEPVVTLCGHLFCWPCLYRCAWPLRARANRGPVLTGAWLLCRWMQSPTCNNRACPVCKAGVEVDKVVPIYGRGSELASTVQEAVKPVPPRPAGHRPAPVPVRLA